jgi:hypothetical protein
MQRWLAQRGNLDTVGEVLRAVREVERKLTASLRDRFIRIAKSKTGKLIPATEADEAKAKTPEHFDGFTKFDRVLIWPEACRGLLGPWPQADIGIIVLWSLSVSAADWQTSDKLTRL